MMKFFSLIIVVAALVMINLPLFAADPCESDINVGGRIWAFHRMEDGNQYHQAEFDTVYDSGDTLVIEVPCGGYSYDSLQIEWDDMRAQMRGELFAFPGNQSLGMKDVGSPASRVSWAINKSVKRLELKFFGSKKVSVKWIRLFYGKKMISPKQQQSSDEGKGPFSNLPDKKHKH